MSQGLAVIVAAFGPFALRTIEIGASPALDLGLGALPDSEARLSLSTSTDATAGYGGVVLPVRWRILGAIEGAKGILPLGWSTAFLVPIIGRIRLIEREIEEA